MSENGAHKDDEQLDVAQDEEMHDEVSALSTDKHAGKS
jgi:hypothetical protein